MLYHFTSCETLLKILLTNELKFSKSINLDDPFERKRSRNYVGWSPHIPESSPAAKNNGYFNSLVDLTNILCFFDSVNDNNEIVDPLADLKMWSHYGKYHQGCCLILDKERTINKFVECVQGTVYEHGRVKYNNLKNYIPAHVSPFQTTGYLDFEFKRLFHNLFFFKGLHYSNENEYRFVVNNRNYNFSLNIIPLIKRVAIAENTVEDNILSVAKLCKLLNIEVGQMVVSNDKLEYYQIPGHKYTVPADFGKDLAGS